MMGKNFKIALKILTALGLFSDNNAHTTKLRGGKGLAWRGFGVQVLLLSLTCDCKESEDIAVDVTEQYSWA